MKQGIKMETVMLGLKLIDHKDTHLATSPRLQSQKMYKFPTAGAARALGIEPVCERASAKHIGDSPTRTLSAAKGRGAPKK
jgi:hypothetical protein